MTTQDKRSSLATVCRNHKTEILHVWSLWTELVSNNDPLMAESKATS